MNIDYNAVIEILKSFLNNEKIEILGISVGKEIQVKDAIRNLLTAYEKEKEKNKELEKMIKKDKDALQFKVGDIVRLKYKSPCTFAIEEGAVCKITNIERQARYPIEIENKFNGIKGYVAEDYIEKIEVEE